MNACPSDSVPRTATNKTDGADLRESKHIPETCPLVEPETCLSDTPYNMSLIFFIIQVLKLMEDPFELMNLRAMIA